MLAHFAKFGWPSTYYTKETLRINIIKHSFTLKESFVIDRWSISYDGIKENTYNMDLIKYKQYFYNKHSSNPQKQFAIRIIDVVASESHAFLWLTISF